MGGIEVRRLVRGDETVAAEMFAMMAAVFDEGAQPLSDGYMNGLLGRDSFWAIAAFAGRDVVGGLTAHTLPMTRSPSSEVFVYDLAVRADHRRQGVGTRLILELRTAAATAGFNDVFVPADNADVGALEFYLAQGATPQPVTIFTFAPP